MSHCECSGIEQLKESLKYVFQLWNRVGVYVFVVWLYVLWLNQDYLFLGFREHVCFQMLRNIQKTFSLLTNIFCPAMRSRQSACICVFLLTLSLCFMKMPSGSLHFFSEGDFWTLCRILGAFYNHLFSCSLSTWPGSEKMMQGCEMGLCLGSSWGKACQKVHKLSWQSVTWPDLGWWG